MLSISLICLLDLLILEILLLDEPTTGLDSCTTRHLVSNLSEIAHRGKIVIFTIHQPRSDVFKMFDKIGILSMGEIVYFGGSTKMVEYFNDIGYPCPTYANPLDHYGNFNLNLAINYLKAQTAITKEHDIEQIFDFQGSSY